MTCARVRPDDQDAGDWLDACGQAFSQRFLEELRDGLDRLGWAWSLREDTDHLDTEWMTDQEARQYRHDALRHRSAYYMFCLEQPCSLT